MKNVTDIDLSNARVGGVGRTLLSDAFDLGLLYQTPAKANQSQERRTRVSHPHWLLLGRFFL